MVQLTVDLQMQWLSTVRALGGYDDGQGFATQLPLHEGRRNRVDRSSRVPLLAGAKGNLMWRLSCGHGVGPGDRTMLVPEQEGHVLF